jgi:hypothetical protein
MAIRKSTRKVPQREKAPLAKAVSDVLPPKSKKTQSKTAPLKKLAKEPKLPKPKNPLRTKPMVTKTSKLRMAAAANRRSMEQPDEVRQLRQILPPPPGLRKRRAEDPLGSSAKRTQSRRLVEVVIPVKPVAEQKRQKISLIPKENATFQATQAAVQFLRSSAIVSENFYFGFEDFDKN